LPSLLGKDTLPLIIPMDDQEWVFTINIGQTALKI
jgi:hypothetical protein